MAGRFPLREVAELLGIRSPDTGPTTLSGFVAHRLGRLPEVGDLVWHAGVQLRVDAVERQRATRIRVALPTAAGAPRRPPDEPVPEELTQSDAQRANVRLARWVAARVARYHRPPTRTQVDVHDRDPLDQAPRRLTQVGRRGLVAQDRSGEGLGLAEASPLGSSASSPSARSSMRPNSTSRRSRSAFSAAAARSASIRRRSASSASRRNSSRRAASRSAASRGNRSPTQ